MHIRCVQKIGLDEGNHSEGTVWREFWAGWRGFLGDFVGDLTPTGKDEGFWGKGQERAAYLGLGRRSYWGASGFQFRVGAGGMLFD